MSAGFHPALAWLAHDVDESARLVGSLAMLDWLNAEATQRGVGKLFVQSPSQPLKALAYERWIYERDEVPTRVDTEHDWLNALVWLNVPKVKRSLNEAHCSESVPLAQNPKRSAQRDALTLFDESGIVLFVDPKIGAVAQAQHAAHAWQALLFDRRAEWMESVRPIAIGHGLLERCFAQPHDALTAKCWWVSTPTLPQSSVQIDAALWQALQDSPLTKNDLRPLPVCGIPSWDARNQAASFYENTQIFRAKRVA